MEKNKLYSYPDYTLTDQEKLKDKYVPVSVAISEVIANQDLYYSLVPSDVTIADRKDYLVKQIMKGIMPFIEIKEEDIPQGKNIIAELKFLVKKEILQKVPKDGGDIKD